MGLRIAYVAKVKVSEESGITRKIRSQMAMWSRRPGVQAALFALVRARHAREGGPVVEATLFPYAPAPWSRANAVRRLAQAVRDWRPTVVYLRQCVYQPGLSRLLRAHPLVVELNTDDVGEMRLRGGPQHAYNRMTRGRVLHAADGLVAVTSELARKSVFARYLKPTCVVPNGFDVSAVEPAPPHDHGRPRLVFSGTAPFPWQGVDKFVEMARRLPAFDFVLVGMEPGKLGLPALPNLRVVGHLAGPQYDRILAEADIGVGTLALHRKGLEEASPLKVREYLAFGLPVIIAYRDSDFPDGDDDFVLRLPNTEDCVTRELPRIEQFVRKLRGRRVPREWVLSHVDAAQKERKRVEFLRWIAERAEGPGAPLAAGLDSKTSPRRRVVDPSPGGSA